MTVDDGISIPKPEKRADVPWRRPEGPVDAATAKRRLQLFMTACAMNGHLITHRV